MFYIIYLAVVIIAGLLAGTLVRHPYISIPILLAGWLIAAYSGPSVSDEIWIIMLTSVASTFILGESYLMGSWIARRHSGQQHRVLP